MSTKSEALRREGGLERVLWAASVLVLVLIVATLLRSGIPAGQDAIVRTPTSIAEVDRSPGASASDRIAGRTGTSVWEPTAANVRPILVAGQLCHGCR